MVETVLEKTQVFSHADANEYYKTLASSGRLLYKLGLGLVSGAQDELGCRCAIARLILKCDGRRAFALNL